MTSVGLMFLTAVLVAIPSTAASESVLRRTEAIDSVTVFLPSAWEVPVLGSARQTASLQSHPAARVEVFDLQRIVALVEALDMLEECSVSATTPVLGVVAVAEKGVSNTYRMVDKVLLGDAGRCHPMPSWIEALAELP